MILRDKQHPLQHVNRSDQILATNNIHRKCVRWWKTLFFHLIDIAIVNSYIAIVNSYIRANSPDEPALKRPASYSLTNFREEVVNGLCGFAEYGPPPPGHVASNLAPPSSEPLQFVTEHIPCFSEEKRTCVVCWQKEKKQYKVKTYCKAPQCNRYMHITNEKNCFEEYHSQGYPYKR